MNMQIPKSMHVPPLSAGITAIVFSIGVMTIVAITGWFHSSFEGSGGISAREQLPAIPRALRWVATSGASHTRAKARCDECGVVESMRRVAPVGNSPALYEITVRMRDGSTRVSSDASPANWRPGEGIILIGGDNQSGG